MSKCKRCGRILRNKESIERGYGSKCYRIIQLNQDQPTNSPNNDIINELLNRVRKLELDRTYILCQLKHKTFVSTSKDSELNWDLPKEVKEVRNQYKIEFNLVIKDLKVIFTEDFNYHDVLKPINPIEETVAPPVMVEV